MDADAVLAEFAARYPPSPMKPQHKQQQQQFGGRRLDEKPVASAATADTDAAMKWMEERLDALTTADPPTSARQRPTPRAAPAATSDFSALAQLEAEVRKLSATLRGERERAASLRAQLAHSGVDDDALPPVTAAAAPPPPAPPASIAVRNPRRGKASVAATGASELAEAASKRAGLLRRQLPSARAELEAVTRECEQLAERLRAAGISVDSRGPSPVDLADGQQQEQPPQRPHPEGPPRAAPPARSRVARGSVVLRPEPRRWDSRPRDDERPDDDHPSDGVLGRLHALPRALPALWQGRRRFIRAAGHGGPSAKRAEDAPRGGRRRL